LDSSLAQAAHDLALQTDGKIVVVAQRYAGAGNGRNNFVVVRLNANGSLDTTFDGDGIVTDSRLTSPEAGLVCPAKAFPNSSLGTRA
jgi:hypothetical protein